MRNLRAMSGACVPLPEHGLPTSSTRSPYVTSGEGVRGGLPLRTRTKASHCRLVRPIERARGQTEHIMTGFLTIHAHPAWQTH
jgi:hypothetical protein